MIIPIRCYTCGKCIGNKYYTYRDRVAELKKKENKPLKDTVINMNAATIEKTVEGRVMDELGLIRLCCRKIFLGHIELV
jgi:DNA-directed RNA polymerase subunit N